MAFIQIKGKEKITESDYLILNSVALIEKNILILENYKFIELFLDNDESANKCSKFIVDQFEKVKDCRGIYFGYKVLSEFLCEKNLQPG